MKVFCSWSGGKDSCLALYKALESGNIVDTLFTAFIASGERSRAHGLRSEIIEAQSKSLGIPLKIKKANWGEYENILLNFISDMKSSGVEGGVFGDIDLQGHKDWIENVCSKAKITPLLPLWKSDRVSLVNEFIELGFKTIIVSIKTPEMKKEYLGQILDKDLVKELQLDGIDPSGEGGEFHTLVIDGPIFNKKIDITIGEVFEDGKSSFLDVSLKRN